MMPNINKTIALRILAAFVLLTGVFSSPAFALEKVALQLKWKHAYQFAGYYVAKELGYYEAAGLDVDIRALKPGQSVVNEVVSGRANFGTGSSGLLLSRQSGAPVVVLAAIFQHSPYVILAKRVPGQPGIQSINKKPILLRPLSDELILFLRHEKIDTSMVIPSSPGMDTVEQLMANQVAAISGYISNEPYRLTEAGFPFEMYSPRSAGIDTYGDNLFTSKSELKEEAERAERFRVASIQGWEYAISHPEESAAIVMKYVPDESPKKIAFERSRILPLISLDLVPVGFMNEARWRQTANIYIQAGSLRPDFSLEGFLYNPHAKKDLSWLYSTLVLLTFFALGLLSVAYYIWRLNARLKSALTQTEHLANHDALTGLPNRALFNDRLQRAILNARRSKSIFALLYVDIDRFKSINDQFGHAAGDEILKAFCNRMMVCIRDSDSLGRLGGDEFVFLLEDLRNTEDAIEVARKLQKAVELGVTVDGQLIPTTISIGIAIYPSDADSEESLYRCADAAMYRSKQGSRNSIYLYAEQNSQS